LGIYLLVMSLLSSTKFERCEGAMAEKRLSHSRMNLAIPLSLILEYFLMEVLLLLLELDSAQEACWTGLVERSPLDLEGLAEDG
jgi:hypothetical protein